MKYRAFVICLLIILCPVIVNAEDVIRIGVLANRGYKECEKKWQPTIQFLFQKIPSHKFQLVPLSFDEVKPAVKVQRIDFLLSNPGMYVDLEAMYGISRIATLRNKVLNGYFSVFGGVIFTRRDNHKINTLKDLKGKRFIAADPDSFGGWLAAWRELHKEGIDPAKDFSNFKFAGNQDIVVFDVLDGKADAGTCRTDLLETLDKNGKIKLKDIKVIEAEGIRTQKEIIDLPFLVSTRIYPEWPMAKLSHTPTDLATKVSMVLLGMEKNDPAAVAADCGGWTYPMNYQPVHELEKELKIGYYKDIGKISFKDVIKKYWLEITVGAFVIIVITVSLIMVLLLYKRLLRIKKELDVEIVNRKKIEEVLIEEKGKLQDALAKVKVLSGFLPICSSCKKIRNDGGYWEQIEIYVKDHSDAEFSHSLCPECIKSMYPQLQKGKK